MTDKTILYEFLFIAVFSGLGAFFGYQEGKKQGQIDCINGKIYYQKVVQKDSSVTWEYVKK